MQTLLLVTVLLSVPTQSKEDKRESLKARRGPVTGVARRNDCLVRLGLIFRRRVREVGLSGSEACDVVCVGFPRLEIPR